MPQTQKSRREILEGFVAANPKDAFARYGLALECAKLADNEAAIENFQQLLGDHPDYVTGYFQYGQLLARIGRVSEAKQTLAAGVAAAQRASNTHARDEMQAALDALG